MILRLKDFVTEQKNIGAENPESSSSVSSKKNLKINWLKPDLAKEIEHYDESNAPLVVSTLISFLL